MNCCIALSVSARARADHRVWGKSVAGCDMIACGRFFETAVGGNERSLSRSSDISSIKLPLKLLFRLGPSYMPSRSPRPRRTLYNHEQLHRSDPLVSQPPRLEMSNAPVHLPPDRTRTSSSSSQRRGARSEFDQQRGRRSPVSNSDAFNQKIWTALERVLLDHPKMNNGRTVDA
jgi:hypothetical protein